MNNTLRCLYQASRVLCLGIGLHGSIVIDGDKKHLTHQDAFAITRVRVWEVI
jgi:hypothetical protein